MNEFSNIFSICHTTYLRKVVWRIRIIINCYYIFWYLHMSNINTRKPEIFFKMQGWNFIVCSLWTACVIYTATSITTFKTYRMCSIDKYKNSMGVFLVLYIIICITRKFFQGSSTFGNIISFELLKIKNVDL